MTTQPGTCYPEENEPAVTEIRFSSKIQARVRFDYRGTPHPARFFFGGRGSREVAENLREQQATLWRNVPLQGVQVDDIVFLDMYSVHEKSGEGEITYAPLEVLIAVDSLEDCLRFVCKAEFRRLQVIHPSAVSLNGHEVERLLYRCHEMVRRKLREQEER